jgi:hypothetical protein
VPSQYRQIAALILHDTYHLRRSAFEESGRVVSMDDSLAAAEGNILLRDYYEVTQQEEPQRGVYRRERKEHKMGEDASHGHSSRNNRMFPVPRRPRTQTRVISSVPVTIEET